MPSEHLPAGAWGDGTCASAVCLFAAGGRGHAAAWDLAVLRDVSDLEQTPGSSGARMVATDPATGLLSRPVWPRHRSRGR